MLTHLTIAQSRYIWPSTIDTYMDLCRAINQAPKYLLANEVTAVWIGKEAEDANVVILYLHGGGYTQSCTIGHMQYLSRLVDDIAADDKITSTVSVLLLEYTLVPEASYPTQLSQAATVLSYLVADQKRNPASIMIMGDSAGGNLALSLLSHILHPRPDIPRISITTPLGGALLVSPWVSFSTKYTSYIRNAKKDSLVDCMLRKWGAMYIGLSKDEKAISEEIISAAKERDSYNEPLYNKSIWWEGMHRVVGDFFLWMGEDEIFIDGLQEFSGLFKQGWINGGGSPEAVQSYMGQGQAHIGPIMDRLMENFNKSQSQLDIESWIRSRLV
ncbi:alpha/beta-hydrolase [Periconia macrospinosa]|uniref:Alpha/beta-hydrolase n=1 Tax=Periconia macrospinosa TaxID=97972 RepID=A0A2V1DTQ4_9PLEO|nr:alpha/beta-hydrolase [Periconia macrospinosa]